MNSKLGNLTRRRSEFEPGEAGAEAAQLKQVERCKRASNSEAADEVKNQVLNSFRYKWSWFQPSAIAITTIFFAALFFSVVIAYSRRSGNTGLDPIVMQKMRLARENFQK